MEDLSKFELWRLEEALPHGTLVYYRTFAPGAGEVDRVGHILDSSVDRHGRIIYKVGEDFIAESRIRAHGSDVHSTLCQREHREPLLSVAIACASLIVGLLLGVLWST